MLRRKNEYALIAVILFCLQPFSVVLALQSDRSKPLHVEADQASLNKKTGVSVYTGKVVIRQGTLVITADKIEVYTNNGALSRILASGKPATYRQRPDKRDEDIVAKAGQMEYDANKGRAVFLNGAELKQSGNTFRSDRIVYDILRDSVDAGKQTGGDRVIITIQPEKVKPPKLPTKGKQ